MAIQEIDDRTAKRRVFHKPQTEQCSKLFRHFDIDAPERLRRSRRQFGFRREHGGVVDYGAKPWSDVAGRLEKPGGGKRPGKIGGNGNAADAGGKGDRILIVLPSRMHHDTPAVRRQPLADRTPYAASAAGDEHCPCRGGRHVKSQRPLAGTLAFFLCLIGYDGTVHFASAAAGAASSAAGAGASCTSGAVTHCRIAIGAPSPLRVPSFRIRV